MVCQDLVAQGFNPPNDYPSQYSSEVFDKVMEQVENFEEYSVNYDIKYRMGNVPESEAWRRGSSEARNGEVARKGPHQLNVESRRIIWQTVI